MKHDPVDAAQAEYIQSSFPDLASTLLNYVVIFEFVYILYNSVCFTFLVNWATIQFVNIHFSKKSLLLGVWPHLRNFWKTSETLKNLCSLTGSRVIPYNLSGVFF